MDRFKNALAPYLPGCPAPLIKQEVLDTAIRFCRKTYVWKTVEDYTAEDGDTEILLFAPPTGAEVITISVEINSHAVSNYTYTDDTVLFDDPLSDGDTASITMYLCPARSATSLPDILYNAHFEAIRAGAMVTLMLMPEKPWSNPALAAAHQQTYLHESGQASINARKRNIQQSQSIQMRPWV
jgi:hypothetical protein